jgi:hypothetical protein
VTRRSGEQAHASGRVARVLAVALAVGAVQAWSALIAAIAMGRTREPRPMQTFRDVAGAVFVFGTLRVLLGPVEPRGPVAPTARRLAWATRLLTAVCLLQLSYTFDIAWVAPQAVTLFVRPRELLDPAQLQLFGYLAPAALAAALPVFALLRARAVLEGGSTRSLARALFLASGACVASLAFAATSLGDERHFRRSLEAWTRFHTTRVAPAWATYAFEAALAAGFFAIGLAARRHPSGDERIRPHARHSVHAGLALFLGASAIVVVQSALLMPWFRLATWVNATYLVLGAGFVVALWRASRGRIATGEPPRLRAARRVALGASYAAALVAGGVAWGVLYTPVIAHHWVAARHHESLSHLVDNGLFLRGVLFAAAPLGTSYLVWRAAVSSDGPQLARAAWRGLFAWGALGALGVAFPGESFVVETGTIFSPVPIHPASDSWRALVGVAWTLCAALAAVVVLLTESRDAPDGSAGGASSDAGSGQLGGVDVEP